MEWETAFEPLLQVMGLRFSMVKSLVEVPRDTRALSKEGNTEPRGMAILSPRVLRIDA